MFTQDGLRLGLDMGLRGGVGMPSVGVGWYWCKMRRTAAIVVFRWVLVGHSRRYFIHSSHRRGDGDGAKDDEAKESGRMDGWKAIDGPCETIDRVRVAESKIRSPLRLD